MIRIGQMAKRAGVSAPTIKHYVNEGLLPKPVKTSKNMAYYDESCIERIKTIKKLQKEKFLPLEVIKRIIDSGDHQEEDLEMGKAILKAHKAPDNLEMVRESNIEKHTGFPIDRINLLEAEGLIHPQIGRYGKEYSETDCRIIEIMRKRDQAGARFDHSVQTIRIYRDAINEAVKKDISYFTREIIGDVSAQTAIKLMTEADEMLNEFMVLFRYKRLNTLGEGIIRETNGLPKALSILNFFPIVGKELPKTPPRNLQLRCFYYLCRGDYNNLRKSAKPEKGGKADYDIVNFGILADILGGRVKEAMNRVETYMSKPSAYVLNNAIAALTYCFSVHDARGFSAPMFNAKKMLHYLKRIEKSSERHVFSMDFASFICGAIYIMLPEPIGLHKAGVEILNRLNWSTTRRKLEGTQYPDWLFKTIDYEIIPAIDLRIHRFLAEGYRKLGERDQALFHLNEILAASDPDDELSEWAGMQRVLITE